MVCEIFFRCVNSVPGLYLHPLRYVINVVFFDCVICVSNCVEGHIHGLMYMGIMIARLLHRKLYAWYNAYRKKENAKVKNYNLRDWDSEMNMKVLNLIMSGWQLAPLRK